MYRTITRYACNICAEQYSSKEHIKTHLNDVHHYPINSFCPYCDSIKLFISRPDDDDLYVVTCMDCCAMGPKAGTALKAVDFFIRRKFE